MLKITFVTGPYSDFVYRAGAWLDRRMRPEQERPGGDACTYEKRQQFFAALNHTLFRETGERRTTPLLLRSEEWPSQLADKATARIGQFFEASLPGYADYLAEDAPVQHFILCDPLLCRTLHCFWPFLHSTGIFSRTVLACPAPLSSAQYLQEQFRASSAKAYALYLAFLDSLCQTQAEPPFILHQDEAAAFDRRLDDEPWFAELSGGTPQSAGVAFTAREEDGQETPENLTRVLRSLRGLETDGDWQAVRRAVRSRADCLLPYTKLHAELAELQALKEKALALAEEPSILVSALLLKEKVQETLYVVNKALEGFTARKRYAEKHGLASMLREVSERAGQMNALAESLLEIEAAVDQDVAWRKKLVGTPNMYAECMEIARSFDKFIFLLRRNAEEVLESCLRGKGESRPVSERRILAARLALLERAADFPGKAEGGLPYRERFDALAAILERVAAEPELRKELSFIRNAAAYRELEASGLFDRVLYQKQLPLSLAAGEDLLAHYILYGTHQGHSPCVFFDDLWYTDKYPDVRRLYINPLYHYLRYGAALGYDPGPDFSTRYYLHIYSDVREAGINPLLHYVLHGKEEGRFAAPRSADWFAGRKHDALFCPEGADAGFLPEVFFFLPEDADASPFTALRQSLEGTPGIVAHTLRQIDELREVSGSVIMLAGPLEKCPDCAELNALVQKGNSLLFVAATPEDIAAFSDRREQFYAAILALSYAGYMAWQTSASTLPAVLLPFEDCVAAPAAMRPESNNAGSALLSLLHTLGAGNAPVRRQRRSAPVPDADPVISVVSVLYRKETELPYYLEALNRQDIQANFEVVLIDDASPGGDSVFVDAWLEEAAANGRLNPRMSFVRLANELNLGNCLARNKAIEASSAPIVLVVDADCMLSPNCLSTHVAAYAKGDCDAAIGFYKIETGNTPPLTVLAALVAAPARAASEAKIQYERIPDHFVNFVTRNASFRKDALLQPCFDPDLSYTASTDSGYGWEDVEVGCRLYRSGKRIRFLPDCFSAHVSHPLNGTGLAVRSLRNFRRLLDKYPELPLLAREWAGETYVKLLPQKESSKAPDDNDDNIDLVRLRAHFAGLISSPVTILRSRPLRILTYRWHAPHQYELWRLGHAFTLATGAGTGWCDDWDWPRRPLPANARFQPLDTLRPEEYDLAILHFDENVLRTDLCNGKIGTDWGDTFKTMMEVTRGLPRVAICHGTPQFMGQYDPDYSGPDLGRVYEDSLQQIRDYMRDTLVVCNSHQAAAEWSFERSTTIWQGFSPHDFPEGTHDKGILAISASAVESRPYYRGRDELEKIKTALAGKAALEYTKTPDPAPGYTPNSPEWAWARFQNYQREIGRYSIYLNTTLRSPMPRARGEAMMTGVIPVCLRNHDVDLFIRNGSNGFYADRGEELAEYILYLLARPGRREAMGKAARRTALDLFNLDRYLEKWSMLIKSLLR